MEKHVFQAVFKEILFVRDKKGSETSGQQMGSRGLDEPRWEFKLDFKI